MAVSVKPAPITLIDPVVEGSNRWRLIGFSVFIGIFIAYIWSFTLVDSVIGDSVANSLLGFDAKETAITSRAMGAIIAIVSGLAGTFTACNIAAFGCIAPLADHNRPLGKRMGTALRPIGWLALGMVGVAGVYGAIGASIGTRIPQLSEEVAVARGEARPRGEVLSWSPHRRRKLHVLLLGRQASGPIRVRLVAARPLELTSIGEAGAKTRAPFPRAGDREPSDSVSACPFRTSHTTPTRSSPSEAPA
jgi:hypothetical protein